MKYIIVRHNMIYYVAEENIRDIYWTIKGFDTAYEALLHIKKLEGEKHAQS